MKARADKPSASFVRWALSALAGAAMLASAAALAAGMVRMRASFPGPGWPFSVQVPFADTHLPGAVGWWHYVAGWETVWSVALVGAVLALQRVPRAQRERAARAVVALQAALLGLVLTAPLPFNAGQYLYVAYAQLVQHGYNPYDPPARSAPLSPQVRAIGTVWGIQEEGNTDPPTRIVMRDRYGPAYALATAALLLPFRAAPVTTQARLIRLWSALAALGCSALLWLLLRGSPWSCAALAAFALNPVVVVQTALDGHNDVVALLGALAACAALSRGWFGAAGAAGALSVATKLTFAPFLLPLPALAWALGGRRGLFAATTALGATLAAVALPFGLARTYVQAPLDARAYNFSYLVSLARAAARHVPALHVPPSLFGTIYVLLIGAAALALARAAARRARAPRLEAALLLLIFCGSTFLPWYATALGPLVLVRARWSVALFLGISLAEQVFGSKSFVGGIDDMPFFPYAALACVLTAAILLAQWLLVPRAERAWRSGPDEAPGLAPAEPGLPGARRI